MKATDFRYDGRLLSDLGFMLCSFSGGSGIDTVSNGSEIKFNTVPTQHGKRHLLSSSEYEDCLQAEFDICKNLCDSDDMVITLDEQREIMRWLNRRTFFKFESVGDIEYNNIYFMGSFNVEKVTFRKDVIGFHLTLTTNAPFGYQEEFISKITVASADVDTTKYKIVDISDEVGYLYMDMTVKCGSSGDLVITNLFDNRVTQIKNCSADEIITLKHPIITSSLQAHKVERDFNFNFVRIGNSYSERLNEYKFSLPCSVEMRYTPIAKVSI